MLKNITVFQASTGFEVFAAQLQKSRRMKHFLTWLLLLAVSTGARALELSHTPKTDEVVPTARPVITVFLPMGQSLKLSEAHLWLNGADVSGQCQKNDAYVTYRPLNELSSGSQSVRFALGSIDLSWTFKVKQLDPIASITLTAPPQPGEFDEVTVEMHGAAHALAWFTVEDIPGQTPMRETSPGVYLGSFEIPALFTALRAQVTGYLRDGQAVVERKARSLSLITSGFRVKILDPEPYGDISGKLTMHARTRPGCDVLITPRIGFTDGIE